MTASDSGAGQQQGREVCLHGRTRQEGCKPCFWVGEQPASSSPAPPARDNEREEKRAQVLQRLGALMDDIDRQTRRSGEPSLRSAAATQARQHRGHPMTEPSVDVEQLQDLLAVATELPWLHWTDQEEALDWDGLHVLGDDAEEGEECNPTARVYIAEDAELILAAVNALPALLDLIRRQDAALTAVRDERVAARWLLERYGHYMSGQPDQVAAGFVTDARQLVATLASPGTTQEQS